MDAITALVVYGTDDSLTSMVVGLINRASDIEALARNNPELRDAALKLRDLAQQTATLRDNLADLMERAEKTIYP